MTKLRVFLVDDHVLLREGLRALIDIQPDLCVVGEAPDGAAALEAMEKVTADVVVMDISMPRMNGAMATQQLARTLPSARVLALTAHEDTEYVQMLLRAGASGFLLKRAAASDLIRAIRAVAAGQLYVDTTMVSEEPAMPALSTPPSPASDYLLSEREVEVLRMIALGYSMKRMAAAVELSPRTLETYKKRAMSKLALTNRADIVRYAIERGWLKDG